MLSWLFGSNETLTDDEKDAVDSWHLTAKEPDRVIETPMGRAYGYSKDSWERDDELYSDVKGKK